jgi:hypothetical protein
VQYQSTAFVISSCSNRKRLIGEKPIGFKGINGQTVSALVQAWTSRLSAAKGEVPAESLYIGRAMAEAKKGAFKLNAPLLVISAGLGLIRGDEMVPPYDLSVADTHGSILPVLRSINSAPRQWWQELNRQRRFTDRPISQLIRTNRQAIVLLAAPAMYLALVRDDLSDLQDSEVERLRIFTSPAGAKELLADLRRAVLPYDERLEATNRAGTRSDFAQRALAHFVLDLTATRLDLESSTRAVEHALASLPYPKVLSRERCTDTELINLLKEHWDEYNGQSSRLLRFLRDEALVACEQSRLRKLCSQIRASVEQMSGGNSGEQT